MIHSTKESRAESLLRKIRNSVKEIGEAVNKLEKLSELPTVQPEVLACGNGELVVQPEPKEGHWINGKCDLCGEHAPFWCMASTYNESNYCPNCGAKMKGEPNERFD